MVTGSLAGQMLGDLGADIVKVEKRDGGDPFRSWRGGTYSGHFAVFNRNKKSITADLRSDEGREIVLRLAERADVLIENFRPGVMDRLGLSFEALRERNQDLIYCSISGFGDTGPYAKRPAFDSVAQSLSGLTSLFVDPDDPQITGPTISDNMTAICACYGLLGAIMERERGGPARRVDVNMIDSSVWFAADGFAHLDFEGEVFGNLSRVRASQSYALTCGDGKLLALHLSSPTKFWHGATAAFELEHLRDDNRFAERMARVDHYRELRDELRVAAAKQPRSYWIERLEANDVPHAPVYRLDEVMDDPQVQHLGTFATVEESGKGAQTFPRRPVWYDQSREDQPLRLAPLLGENTDEVLASAGYSEVEVADLRDRGVI